MRIRDFGSGFFGFGGGGGSRSDSFKKGRKPGQKVRGKLVKWVAEDMAWVEIEGHRLLAKLSSKPPVGASLTFVIKQIHPDIILKEVFGARALEENHLSLATDFETARTLFESALRPVADRLEQTRPTNRLAEFTANLSNNTKLLTSFLDAVACLQSINSQIQSESIGTLMYQPWVIPKGRRHVTLIRSTASNLAESTVEFELNQFGIIRTEFLSKPPVPDTGSNFSIWVKQIL